MSYWPLMKNTINWWDRFELIKFILTSDKFTNGIKVKEFEKAWSEWLGVKHSLFVSSGSTANLLLVSAVKELYKIPNGSKVLLPACTWVTNVAPILQLGLEPVFCDISLDNFSFNLQALPKADIKIVFVTHLLGLDAPVEKLKERYPKALFIEDICESHGVTDSYGVKRGGESSLGSTFSFYYGHHMTTVEGGMVSTNNKELYNLMKLKRSHGMARELDPEDFKTAAAQYPNIDPRFLFLTDGFNFRNTELGAVLGLSQLPRLDDTIQIRKRNYRLFVSRLKQFDEFYIPSDAETNSSFCLPIVCKSSETMKNLKREFEANGIETRPIVSGNLLGQPFLRKYATISVPNAKIVNDNGVYVGNNQYVTEEMVSTMFKIIEKVLGIKAETQ
jgi:CDP-6-deoxy-D-xylo-4-hexulose-3-dehydrase